MRKQVTITDEESATKPGDRLRVVARFNTVKEAEDWIAEREKIDPDKVHRGGYGINAPEKMVNPPRPTDEQLQAVQAFAAKYATKRGGWKEHLITCWMNGADAREPNGHLLRQVRNQFGPSWLKTWA
jgi:hypothetical protein